MGIIWGKTCYLSSCCCCCCVNIAKLVKKSKTYNTWGNFYGWVKSWNFCILIKGFINSCDDDGVNAENGSGDSGF